MNLHALAVPAISVVNPMIDCVVRVNIGTETAPTGRTRPIYAPDVTVKAQVQDLSQKEVRQVNALNHAISNTSVYLYGRVDALVRKDNKGGDILIFRNQTWLVVAVLEAWPDWTKVAVVLQRDEP